MDVFGGGFHFTFGNTLGDTKLVEDRLSEF